MGQPGFQAKPRTVSLEGSFRSIREALDDLGTSWALVGGLAVGARTEPRFTRDVDLAVETADDAAAEDLLHHLMSLGYHLVALVEQHAVGRLATARLQAPGLDHLVDLLFASSGIEPEAVRDAEPVEVFPGVVAPVARLPHLAAMKLLARDDTTREQDRGDLHKLLRACTPRELAETRVLLGRIRERGFHRGRDLEKSLSQTLQETSCGEG